MIVYSVTNKLNNKKYICVTLHTKLKHAIYSHRHRAKAIMKRMKLKPTSRMGKSPFHRALARYGESNFKYRVIDTFYNKTDAYACKERLIDKYNTINPEYGYNCTTGGDKSFKHAPHSKKRISVAHTGKIMPESWVEFMKDEVKNHPESHPTFQKGYKHTDVARENMRQGQLNSDYVQTEEQQRKKSVSMKKRWQEPEIIAKMAKREKGGVTDETRRKLSKRSSGKNNGMYGKPAWNRGIPMTEDQKIRLNDGRRKYHAKKRKALLEIYSERTEKECYKCNQIKKLDLFYNSRTHLDGYAGMCISCDRQRKKERRK